MKHIPRARCHNEKRLAVLLGQGYLPKELPRTFTSRSFGRHALKVIEAWEYRKVFSRSAINKRRSNSFNYKLGSADAEVFSIPKRAYERRPLHITHPLPQALLCYELSYNWQRVQKWLSNQRFSVDRIDVSPRYLRALPTINFETHESKKRYIESICDWIVKTDITNFYHTIYTHSIPWAACGKENVKSNINNFKGSLADRVDLLLRCCNRNQTIGIPVGPETSRIVAEIISSKIDSELQYQNPSDFHQIKCDRMQDDWTIGVHNQQIAEEILSQLSQKYQDFGLQINGLKTSIQHLSERNHQNWVSEISQFLNQDSKQISGVKLGKFLDFAYCLQCNNPDQSVTTYVNSALESQEVQSRDVAALESFLLRAAVISPKSMDRICEFLISIQRQTGCISKKRIRDRFTQLAEKNLCNGFIFEAVWQIYAMRGLGIKVYSKQVRNLAVCMNSSVLALTLLDMEYKGLLSGGIEKSGWESQINKDTIRQEWIWLLAYDGIRQGWIKDRKNVMDDPLFKSMDDFGVFFYDKRRNVEKPDVRRGRRVSAKRNNRKAAVRKINRLRGFGIEYW